ncbi:ATP-binding protein [Thalassotalea profundi]|uniref:histidine kinase n=1 Tax=Thalassotalea profundi TaxID=2036687 RepID=A0ABQ3INI1_9GAMM|nr:ATP-binding protein [Thalassotalea profundi]GHE84883.1 two-component sensor histidine kinase [Thalassotalea profundi]
MKRVFNLFSRSLKARLFLSLIVMVIIVLPSIGMIITNAYEQHMNNSIENELSAYIYSILAVAEVEESKLIMPEVLAENQFNVSQSGLYAVINTLQTPISNDLWHSQSLLTIELPDFNSMLQVGSSSFTTINISQQPHFIYSYAVSFGDEDESFPFSLHIIKEKNEFLQLMTEFKQQLLIGLSLLISLILIIQFIWLKWTLKPLLVLEKEIKAIEQGKVAQLTANYPQELAKVTTQLNSLLATELQQRKRYRNALSDLAHSLKTPLAVLQADPNITEQNQEQIDRINFTIEHQLKRAQSAGHTSWLLGINVASTVNKLINSLEKIYRDKAINLIITIDKALVFKGDEADLLELLGNLLDNAFKAAKHTIKLTIVKHDNCLTMTIEDDGVGIDEQQKKTIFDRGVRADTYEQGHGVGLAIVRDLVQSYNGKLEISNSDTLGGAKFTLIFSS